MALLHRALFTWFLFMVFLVLLALRMDNRTEWNWFVVFLPMWFYDSILVMYIAMHMVNDCRLAGLGSGRIKGRRLWILFAVILKLTFMIMLCFRLEGVYLSWSVIFSPLLTFLVGLSINLSHVLVKQWRDEQ